MRQIRNRGIRFAKGATGPYARKLSSTKQARAAVLGQKGFQRFGVVNEIPPNVNNRVVQEGEDWSLWTEFTSGGGTVVLSGTNNSTAVCTATTGGRAWLAVSGQVQAGRTYAASFEVTAIGANQVQNGILVTGDFAGGSNNTDPTSTGWWGIIFTAASTQTKTLRMGVGTSAGVSNDQSITISQPMFQDITDHSTTFSAWTRTKTTTAWNPGNTLNGTEGLVNAAQGTAIPEPYNDYTDIMAVGDSFANESDEWPSKLEIITAGVVRGDGFSGVGFTGVGGIQENFSALLAVGDYTCAVVQGGVNDVNAGVSLSAMQTAVNDMKSQCDAKPCKMIMVNIAPWANNASWNATKQTDTEAYNNWLTGWCRDNNVGLADIYANLGDSANSQALASEYDSGDGLHPNEAGSEFIAQLIKTEMR